MTRSTKPRLVHGQDGYGVVCARTATADTVRALSMCGLQRRIEHTDGTMRHLRVVNSQTSIRDSVITCRPETWAAIAAKQSMMIGQRQDGK